MFEFYVTQINILFKTMLWIIKVFGLVFINKAQYVTAYKFVSINKVI